MTEARCHKCKKQVEMTETEDYVSKNNLNMVKGKCPVCGTRCCRIIGKAA